MSSNSTLVISKLKDVADIVMGQSPKGETCNKECKGLPLLNGPSEFGAIYPVPVQYTTDPKKKANQGDLLFCVRGSTVGRMNWADREYAIGRGLASISSKDSRCRHFVKALIDYNMPYILNISTGSTFPNITKDMLNNLPVLLPPKEEQRLISRIFESIDDKIELNNAINKNLEEMAQALFKHWFVDFEFPNENGEPYKSSGGEFVESELGLIPKGWKVGRATDLFNVLSGGTPKTKVDEYWNGHIPFFTPKDCNNSFYVIETEKTLTEMGLENCNSKLYPPDTVFITARGTVGKVALAGTNMAMNQSCYALVGKDGYTQTFVFLQTKELVKTLQKNANGAVFDAITVATFKSLKVILPNIRVVNNFDLLIKDIFTKILLNVKENKVLIGIRDTLLPKLMSGEIRVPVEQD